MKSKKESRDEEKSSKLKKKHSKRNHSPLREIKKKKSKHHSKRSKHHTKSLKRSHSSDSSVNIKSHESPRALSIEASAHDQRSTNKTHSHSSNTTHPFTIEGNNYSKYTIHTSNEVQSQLPKQSTSTDKNQEEQPPPKQPTEYELNAYRKAFGLSFGNFSILTTPYPTFEHSKDKQMTKITSKTHKERYWTCPRCSKLNYQTHYQCTQCNRLRGHFKH